MEITYFDFKNLITTFLLVTFRVSGIVMSAPIFSMSNIPNNIKLIFILVTSMMIFSLIPMPVIGYSIFEYFILIAHQILMGLVVGFIMQLAFQAFSMMGEILAFNAGLGFAVQNDPTSDTSVTMISQIYTMLISILFFAFDGHILFFKILKDTFTFMPIGFNTFDNISFYDIAHFANLIFSDAVKITLPLVAILMLVNISLGIMTRAAPQINIFSIGFPITMIVGSILLYASINTISEAFHEIFQEAVNFITDLLGVNYG